MYGRPAPRIEPSSNPHVPLSFESKVLEDLRKLAIRTDSVYSKNLDDSSEESNSKAVKAEIKKKLIEILADFKNAPESQISEMAQLVTRIGKNYNLISSWQVRFSEKKRVQYFHDFADCIPPQLIPLIPEELLKPTQPLSSSKKSESSTLSDVPPQLKPKPLLANLQKLADRSDAIYSSCLKKQPKDIKFRKIKDLIKSRLVKLFSEVENTPENQLDKIARLVSQIGNNYNRIAEMQGHYTKRSTLYYFDRLADRIPLRLMPLLPEELLKRRQTPTRKRTMSEFDDEGHASQSSPSVQENSCTETPPPMIDFLNDDYFSLPPAAPCSEREEFHFG